MNATTQYPDIERAATMILAQQVGWCRRRELHDWVQRIIADPECTDRLDRATVEAVLEHRFVVTDAVFWAERSGCSEAEAAEEYADQIGTEWPDQFARNIEEAIYRLSSAVGDFRVADRPTGDVTTEIMGLGSPLVMVTTSLAAAVAEYVSNLTNAWALELQAAEDRLTDAVAALP